MGFFALALLLAVVLGGEILLYRKFSLSHLEYHCALDREEATEGDVVELVETIKNRKWLPEPWLKSEITTSKWLDFAGAQSIVTDKTRFVPSFFVVRSFQKVQRSWHVTCLKRGDFAIQKVGLVASDLFGTVNVSRAAEVDSRILVLPKGMDLDAFALSPRYLSGDVVVRRQLLEDPFYLAGVREYTEHDSMNQIHWAATVKEGKFMVHNREHTSSQNLTVILNMQSMPFETGQVTREEEVEYAIKVCASFFEQTLVDQTPVQFFANASTTEELVSTYSGEYWGDEHVHDLLCLLAKLHLESTDDIGVYLNDLFDQVQTSDCVLATAYLNEDLLSFARQKAEQGVRVRIYVTGRVSASMLSDDCEIYCLRDYLEELEEQGALA